MPFNMKNLKLVMIVATLMLAAVSCGPKKTQNEGSQAPKVLVLYYSQTSNTKIVAQEIATQLDADMEEIVAVQPYDGDFNATIERCLQEQEQGVLPEIKPISAKLSEYDIIFIGYPVWFGTYAPPVATFLKQNDLSGKTLVPFCTFGSGGLASSSIEMAKAQPNAHMLSGYGVRAARLSAAPKEIEQYLKENHFIEGEFVQLPDFDELHPVSADEAAIFDAAVGDYPMMHAKAEMVGARTVPNGMEYLFIAVDLPREDNPNMPPAGEMKVYVLVENGQDPVFTQVVR